MSGYTALEEAQNGPVFVHQLVMMEDAVQLNFTEKRELSEAVSIERGMTLLIDNEQKEQVYLRIQQDLQWLVDEGYVELRNPPVHISRAEEDRDD